MRSSKRFAAGLAVLGVGAVGLAGCTAGSGFPLPPASGPPASRPAVAARAATSTAPPAAPVSPRLRAGARAAAAQALGMYAAGQFATFWQLLSPAAKRQIPSDAWVGVHESCPAAGGGTAVAVTAVTVFGQAAIVTEAIGSASPRTTEVVFNDVNGQWSYSPSDPGVYEHGSIAADVAAAKAAGYCGGWKIF